MWRSSLDLYISIHMTGEGLGEGLRGVLAEGGVIMIIIISRIQIRFIL